jgi:hypothetical protein
VGADRLRVASVASLEGSTKRAHNVAPWCQSCPLENGLLFSKHPAAAAQRVNELKLRLHSGTSRSVEMKRGRYQRRDRGCRTTSARTARLTESIGRRTVPNFVPSVPLFGFVSKKTRTLIGGSKYKRCQTLTNQAKHGSWHKPNLRDQGVVGSNPLSPTILHFLPLFAIRSNGDLYVG